jgi:type IV pilus assembly protein PilF
MSLKKISKIALVASFSFTLWTGCATSKNDHAPRKLSKVERFNAAIDVASAAITEGDYTGALISLNEAQEIDNDSDRLHYLFALAYYNKGELAMATDSARTALEINPKFSSAKNTLGKLLMDQGYFLEAEKYLSEAARDLLNQEAHLAETNLGILNYKKGNPEKALIHLNKAIRNNPESTCIARYYRGKIELDRNEFDLAQSDFTASSKGYCARLSDAHLLLGKTFIRQRKFDQARAKFLELQQLFPHTESAKEAGIIIKEIP